MIEMLKLLQIVIVHSDNTKIQLPKHVKNVQCHVKDVKSSTTKSDVKNVMKTEFLIQPVPVQTEPLITKLNSVQIVTINVTPVKKKLKLV